MHEDERRRGAGDKVLPMSWVGATLFYHDRPREMKLTKSTLTLWMDSVSFVSRKMKLVT